MHLHAIGTPPREGTGARPLLVLLHGLGADEYDLIGLSSELDPDLNVVSIRAPHETGYGGYAWFGIEFRADGTRLIDEVAAVRSCELAIDDLEEIVKHVQPSRVILGGFSQGAMIAAGVLLRRPDLLDAAWLMSAKYLQALDNGTEPARPVSVLVQHGLYDELLPVTDGREIAEVLRVRGHEVLYREYPVAHEIGIDGLRDADRWIGRSGGFNAGL